MTGVYDSERLAAGYAFDRPPVHERVLESFRPTTRAARALDVGCGAGLSTAALHGLADTVVGLEPEPAMLAYRRSVAPQARFVVGRAESLPFEDSAFDLVAASGSLDHVDLPRFLGEAARVLTTDGALVVYGFSEGRRSIEGRRLAAWFDLFEQRYPWPPGCAALSVDDVDFDRYGLSLHSFEDLEMSLPMSQDAYLRYVLSEVNVDAAVRAGAPEDGIRQWCRDTLAEVFAGRDLNVVFKGYLACARPVLAFHDVAC